MTGDDKLFQTADNNNDGISLEKSGRIDEAILVYEANIVLEYPATHSYERLMVLYRKLKMPEQELAVIEKAIKGFSKENKRRFEAALADPKNKSILSVLRDGYENCQGVRLGHWYVYSPYRVDKYVKRKEKVLKALSRLNSTINH